MICRVLARNNMMPSAMEWFMRHDDSQAGQSLLATLAIACILAIGASPASAAAIDWAQWSRASVVTGTPTGGSVSGLVGGVGVSYSGELTDIFAPEWTYASTFMGGTISNGPAVTDLGIGLFGGPGTSTNTITFSTPVINPVMAIWSLGGGIQDTTFVFDTDSFSIQSGGPNFYYGGQSITQVANVVHGIEGNGTMQFLGTFTSISWTNPIYENVYVATVGIPHDQTFQTPLPAALPLFATGLGVVGLLARRRKRNQSSA
jgi:hypothetical protein